MERTNLRNQINSKNDGAYINFLNSFVTECFHQKNLKSLMRCLNK